VQLLCPRRSLFQLSLQRKRLSPSTPYSLRVLPSEIAPTSWLQGHRSLCTTAASSHCIVLPLTFPSSRTDEDGAYLSSGDGLVRDTHTILLANLYEPRGRFLAEMADGYHTLRPLRSNSAARTPLDRLADVAKLGAVIAKTLCSGGSIAPMDPCFVLLALHNFDISKISPHFFRTFHADLYEVILRFQQMGPHGDLAEFLPVFSTYMNINDVCIS
jgi:hypothetical protein